MARMKTWAVMAVGLWTLSAALGYAAGQTEDPVLPQPTMLGDGEAVGGNPAPGWQVEPLAVTPPLVAGGPPPAGVYDAGCGTCGRCRRLLEWLTYSSTQPGLCHCCHQVAPCCYPPLYTYFPCRPDGGCCATSAGGTGPGLGARAKDWLCQRPGWGRLHQFVRRIEYKKPAPCPAEPCQ